VSLQRPTLLVLLPALLVGSLADRSILAQTQTEASAALETEIPGVAAFTRPPASFNPLTATDAELDRYGFRRDQAGTWGRTCWRAGNGAS